MKDGLRIWSDQRCDSGLPSLPDAQPRIRSRDAWHGSGIGVRSTDSLRPGAVAAVVVFRVRGLMYMSRGPVSPGGKPK
jgi:hypothetical protein